MMRHSKYRCALTVAIAVVVTGSAGASFGNEERDRGAVGALAVQRLIVVPRGIATLAPGVYRGPLGLSLPGDGRVELIWVGMRLSLMAEMLGMRILKMTTLS